MILKNQLETSSSILADYLIRNELSISFAESITGGKLMSSLVSTPGISKVLLGGVVCYNASLKKKLLSVPDYLIEQYTTESAEVSIAIAKGIQKLTKAKISVGITGLASLGASASPLKPVGTVYTCFMINRRFYLDKFIHQGNRDQIRTKASIRCFNLLLMHLKSGNIILNENFEKVNKYEKA